MATVRSMTVRPAAPGNSWGYSVVEVKIMLIHV